MNDNEFNINSLLTKKLFFEMNSERTKKRMAQMKRIKNTINENDTPKEDKSTFNSTQSPTNEDYNLNHQSNRKNQNNNKNNEIDNLNNVFNNNNNINVNNNNNIYNNINDNNNNDNNNDNNNNNDNLFNPFINNDEINENNDNVEINISDLDLNINDLNENENENLNNKNLINNSKNEYAKIFCSSNSKSFIHLNNNLIAKAATKNEKNTNSYLLALCPELIINKNKEKNLDNYYVDDVIKEENEIEIPLKNENNTIENNIKLKGLLIDEYNQNKIFHQKAKSGNDFKEILTNSPKISRKLTLKKHIKNNIKKAKNLIDIKRQNLSDFSKTFCSPIHKINKLSKINLSIQKENRSNSKNKKNKKFINIHHQYFSNKIPKIKMKIAIMSNNNSRSNSNHHIKNKTTFTSPSYINKIEYNTIYNYSKSNNKLYNKKYNFNNNKLVNKTNYRLFEIKKTIKTLGNNLRKNNNFGLFFPNSNKNNNNSNSIILHKSFANFEISNRNKIINAMQKINFSPISFYSKSLNELNKSKGNLFCILVSNDKIKNNNKQYLFKGLYEINQNEGSVFGKSVFCITNAPKIIKINDYENFLNYDLNKGNFEKYKFLLKGNKTFNCSTIIVY